MKLSRSFTERARLTKAYDEVIGNINRQDFDIEVKDPEFHEGKIHTFGSYATKAPKYELDALLSQQAELGNALSLFNAAIDKANADSEARFILSQLTNLRRQTATFSRLAMYQDTFVETKEEYNSHKYDDKGNLGTFETKYFVPASKQNFTELCKMTERSIRELEDKLSEVNATTEVNVPQEVIDILAKI